MSNHDGGDYKQKGMTQEQLAEKLNISVSNLGKIEVGYSGVSIDLVIEMAMFFGVSLDYILLERELQTDDLKRRIVGITVKLLLCQ